MNVDDIQEMVERDGIIFLSYGGFLTQTLITGMTEALEKEAEYNDLNMSVSNNLFTIFIELSQNMMNYSKTQVEDCTSLKPEGLIVVGKDKEGNYYVHSQNVIAQNDKDKIEPKITELLTMPRDEVKKRYRELRRSGRDTHGKGGGIGFYEVAKRSDEIQFEFKPINNNKYYFHFISKISINKEK